MKLSVTSWSFPACTLSEAWAVARALGFVEAVFAFGEGCVEECKTWGWGLGDGGVLGAGEEGEGGEGQEFLEIHG